MTMAKSTETKKSTTKASSAKKTKTVTTNKVEPKKTEVVMLTSDDAKAQLTVTQIKNMTHQAVAAYNAK